jgi:hypothetical protein
MRSLLVWVKLASTGDFVPRYLTNASAAVVPPIHPRNLKIKDVLVIAIEDQQTERYDKKKRPVKPTNHPDGPFTRRTNVV